MFSKAPIRRYYDSVEEGPGPTSYDPHLANTSRTVNMEGHGSRFSSDPKNESLGPGTYDLNNRSLVGRNPVNRGSLSKIPVFCPDEFFKTPKKLKSRPLRRWGSVCSLPGGDESLRKELESALFTVERKQKRCLELETSRGKLLLETDNLSKDKISLQETLSATREEIDSLRRENSEILLLQERNSTLISKENILTNQLTELQRLNEALEANLKERGLELKEVKEVYVRENEDMKKEFVSLREETSFLQASNVALKVENGQLATENEDLTIANFRLIGENNDLKIRWEDRLKFSEEKKKEEVKDLLEKIDELKSEVKVVNEEKLNAEQKANDLNLDLASLLAEKLSLEKKFEKLTSNFESLSSKLNESEKELTETQIRFKDVEQKAAEYERLLNINITKVEEWDRLMTDIKSENEELEMKNSSLEGSLSALRQELLSSQSESMSKISSLEAKIEEQKEVVEDLLETKRDLNETCLVLEKRMISAEDEVKELKAKEEEAPELLEELKLLNEELSVAHAEIESKYHDSSKTIEELEETISKLENEQEYKLSEELQRLSITAEEEIRNLIKDKETALESAKENEILTQELKDELQKRDKELAEYAMKTNDSLKEEGEISSLQKIIEDLNKRILDLETALEEKTKEATNLSEELKELRRIIEPYKEQIDQYEAERAALLSENDGAHKEAQRLAADFGKTLGHQNHKQKIKIMVKLKQENVDNKIALHKAGTEIAFLKKKIQALENGNKDSRRETVLKKKVVQQPDRTTKENSENVASNAGILKTLKPRESSNSRKNAPPAPSTLRNSNSNSRK